MQSSLERMPAMLNSTAGYAQRLQFPPEAATSAQMEIPVDSHSSRACLLHGKHVVGTDICAPPALSSRWRPWHRVTAPHGAGPVPTQMLTRCITPDHCGANLGRGRHCTVQVWGPVGAGGCWAAPGAPCPGAAWSPRGIPGVRAAQHAQALGVIESPRDLAALKPGTRAATCCSSARRDTGS